MPNLNFAGAFDIPFLRSQKPYTITIIFISDWLPSRQADFFQRNVAAGDDL
jgi:hypothetical protein